MTGGRRAAAAVLCAAVLSVLGFGMAAHAFLDQGWNKRGSYVPCMHSPLHPDDVTLEQGPVSSEWSVFPLGVTCGWGGYSRQAETSNTSWAGSAQLGLGGVLVLGSFCVLGRAAFRPVSTPGRAAR